MMTNNSRIAGQKHLVECSLGHWQYKLEELKQAMQQIEFNLDFLSWYHKLLQDDGMLKELSEYPDYLTFYKTYIKKYPAEYMPLGNNFTDTTLFGYPMSVVQQYYKDSAPCEHDQATFCWKCDHTKWRVN